MAHGDRSVSGKAYAAVWKRIEARLETDPGFSEVLARIEALGRAELPLGEIAAQSGMHPSAVLKILRALELPPASIRRIRSLGASGHEAPGA